MAQTFERTGGSAAIDRPEQVVSRIDEATEQATGMSLLHIATLASIGASVALFLSGRTYAAIFVGLWPPTLQALKAVTEESKRSQ